MTDTTTPRGAQIVAIVDDDDAIRPAIARLIETLGYQPRTFANAEALLVAFSDLQLACVLTDVQMPGINGHALARELHRRRPELPIVLMTAYPGPASREVALAGGTLEFMTKPLDDKRLEAWLRRTIGEPPPF
jgi:FixJ family two-component response regulator